MNAPPTVNVAAARQFFQRIDPEAEFITFQTFDDGAAKQKALARIVHADPANGALDTLAKLNVEQTAGVFFAVNATDGKGRQEHNIVRVRAAFVDLDGAPLAPVLAGGLDPHIVVESSPGKWHAYWLTDDCPLSEFSRVQKALARRFGGDPSVHDLPRVLRVPGFLHRKGEPFMSHVVDGIGTTAPPYALAEIVGTLKLDLDASDDRPKAAPTGAAGKVAPGGRHTHLFALGRSMARRSAPEAVTAALAAENQARCDPPVPDTDIAYLADRAFTAKNSPDWSDRATAGPTLDEWKARIAATDDFDTLTKVVVGEIANSNLSETERDILNKLIAKKSGASISAVRDDAKAFRKILANKDEQHLFAAREVAKKIGLKDIIGTGSAVRQWNGCLWGRVEDRVLKQHIHAVAGGFDLTQSVVNSILDLLKTEVFRGGHRFDQATDAINCVSGSLRYDGGWVLAPHCREHYLTTCIPVAYDPGAAAPRFRQFLAEIFKGDADAADKVAVIEEALGYTLIPSCHLEKFFMLIGSGANGKSVLLNVLTKLVGREQVSAVQPAQLDNKFQRGHLLGKLANVVTEVAEGGEIADAALKALVSGEIQTAEHKFQDPFDFLPVATFWIGTNHLPHTRDFSDALFRRAVVISFNRKFDGADRDVHLTSKLEAELPGILNIALSGLARLIERGSFTSPASCAEISATWRLEADQAAQFAADECIVPAPGASTPSNEVYARYRRWADDAGIQRRLGRNTLSNRLQRLGCVLGKGSGGLRVIHGLRLRPTTDFEAGGGYGAHRG